MIKRILITPGEPAGIGPDVTIRMAEKNWPAELIVIADPDMLLERAKLIGVNLKLIEDDLANSPEQHIAGTLKIIPIKLKTSVKPQQLDKKNAAYVMETLEKAASLCKENKAHAIVTGPVHKGIINDAGISFSGHTEFFREVCGIENSIMLFVVDKLKVALATTHIPLSQVPKAITKNHLHNLLLLLHEELKQKFNIASPKILVCGLNPHAGEQGYLGKEEIDIITPVINELHNQGLNINGPFPADTVFTPKHLDKADVILAMYHDQALPVVKYIGFDHAVNVTLGLPFIRTSVDHGTALEIAGTNKVNPGSMIAALKLACEL